MGRGRDETEWKERRKEKMRFEFFGLKNPTPSENYRLGKTTVLQASSWVRLDCVRFSLIFSDFRVCFLSGKNTEET